MQIKFPIILFATPEIIEESKLRRFNGNASVEQQDRGHQAEVLVGLSLPGSNLNDNIKDNGYYWDLKYQDYKFDIKCSVGKVDGEGEKIKISYSLTQDLISDTSERLFPCYKSIGNDHFILLGVLNRTQLLQWWPAFRFKSTSDWSIRNSFIQEHRIDVNGLVTL